MNARLRSALLTAHVTSAVGWLGAVAAFLVLAIAGLKGADAQLARGAYLSMDLIYRAMIVPIGLIALATGLVQALATPWGLFRHYWVLVKFLLTVGASILMLVHVTAVQKAAARVLESDPSGGVDVGRVGVQLAGDSGLALLVLLTTTILAIYKPWGMTRYGAGRRDLDAAAPPGATPWGPYVVIGLFVLALLFVGVHLMGGGLGSH